MEDNVGSMINIMVFWALAHFDMFQQNQILNAFFTQLYSEMVGSPYKSMCSDGGSKEKYWDSNQRFGTGITQSKMEHNTQKDAAATQSHTLCSCLKSVISIRKPDNSNAA
jgi:hypothetical protein